MSFVPDPGCDTSPDETPVWHYLRFGRFQWTARTRSIWVPRFSALQVKEDPQEATLTRREFAALARHGLIRTPSGRVVNVAARVTEIDALSYVSCWAEGDEEDARMWAEYAGSGTDAGVVIVSSVGGLKRFADGVNSNVTIGRCSYDRDEKSEGYPLGSRLFFRKRPKSAGEREVRAGVLPAAEGPRRRRPARPQDRQGARGQPRHQGVPRHVAAQGPVRGSDRSFPIGCSRTPPSAAVGSTSARMSVGDPRSLRPPAHRERDRSLRALACAHRLARRRPIRADKSGNVRWPRVRRIEPHDRSGHVVFGRGQPNTSPAT